MTGDGDTGELLPWPQRAISRVVGELPVLREQALIIQGRNELEPNTVKGFAAAVLQLLEVLEADTWKGDGGGAGEDERLEEDQAIETFLFLVKTYAREKDENMTPSAVVLANKVRAAVRAM